MVEGEESQAAKRRARSAALAAELDSALTGAFGRSEQSVDPKAATTTEASGAEDASVYLADGGGRPPRRRFQRVKLTLSVADARDEGRVQELVQTVLATSRKRRQTKAGNELATSAAAAATSGVSSSDRGKDTADDDAPRLPPTKRVTRLDRAPGGMCGGGGASPGQLPDAMSDYFRMYDLVCNDDQEEKEEEKEKRGRENLGGAARKPAGRGLQRGRKAAGATAVGSGTPSEKSAQRRVDVDDGDDDGEQKVAALMCDYLPMVREYLGDGAPLAADKKVDSTSDGDTYVYDVYVQVEDGEEAHPDAAAYGDGGFRHRERDEGEATSVIYVGGHDSELFFDAMDGLVDDERDDDVDSEDSNREDAPCADYPDEEDKSEDEWDDEDDGDGDSDDSDGPRRRMDATEGFYRGERNTNTYGGDSEGDGWDFDEGFSGYRPEMSSGDQYRETAYDPEYDDVTDDNYYS